MPELRILGVDIDRTFGGRHGHFIVDRHELEHPKTQRAFQWVYWILLAEVAVGLAAVAIAVVLQTGGTDVGFAAWFRGVVVLLMTLTLFFFAWRARHGYYWGYQRLRLFSQIFPVVSLVVATIPGLYPYWMVVEQIVFAVLMIGVADVLTNDHMRAAFMSPRRRAELREELGGGASDTAPGSQPNPSSPA
ncbi:hypothetical protein J2W21_002577 [Sinomonas atrocyanea]|uniref:hypothetical protein n=1 Tax=Sinomonas atrocyanea TaxID=37927 RepID=UPI00277F36FF|nr:hypothetical protein [Sinomonas atrocyanea]MDP9885059.1 hypothetical protein [Sinomonas atrocyanea]